MPAIVKLRAWFFPLFTTDMRICYLTVFYLVATGSAPARVSALVPMIRLLISIGVYGAWGVLVNDWVDRDLDAAAGKRTGVEGVSPFQIGALFVLLPLAGLILVPEPSENVAVLVIFAVCYAMAFIYSAPAGRRLKEKGVWGFIADVLLEKPLPPLVFFAYFGHVGPDVLILAAFYSSMGAFTLALHQVWDYDSDMVHGVRTLAVAIGKDRLLCFYRLVLAPFFLVAAGLSLFVIAIGTGRVGAVLLGIFVAASIVLVYLSLKGIVRRDDPNRRGVSPEVWFIYTFFDGPLPTLLGIFVIVEAPIFLPIFIALFVSQYHKFRRHYRQAFRKMIIALRG